MPKNNILSLVFQLIVDMTMEVACTCVDIPTRALFVRVEMATCWQVTGKDVQVTLTFASIMYRKLITITSFLKIFYMKLLLNFSTTDIDECDANRGRGACAHRCVNHDGGFQCSCNHGYNLASDGTSCTGLWQ